MKNTTLNRYVGSLVCGGKTSGFVRALAKLVVVSATIFASVHLVSATEVDVLLTSQDYPASDPNGNYWNVLEFADKDGSCESACPALDINGDTTGISVSSCSQGWESYCADTAGGDITVEIDLPTGTFNIDPALSIGCSSVTITGGSFTCINGPTNVYLDYLNNGYPVTTATTIVITETTAQVDVLLTSQDYPASDPDDNYWNVLEFADKDGSCESACPALDINGDTTGISVFSCSQGWESYCADTAGGDITIEIDLPCGTFDVIPGFAGPGSSCATITGGCFTGIIGPTTVYLNFLNNGYPVTTAGTIQINQY